MNQQTRFFLFMLLFIWLMSSNPNVEERYPPFIERPFILDQYKSEVNISRHSLLTDYNAGYGNITGFRLSYNDAITGRNISEWPFPDKKGPFIEEEEYSILPNLVSRRAANVWNAEGKCVELPSTRNDKNDEHTGVKKNTGAFPLNITGNLYGDFAKVKLEKKSLLPIHMPLPGYMKRLYEFRKDEQQRKDDERNQPQNDEEDYGALDVDMITYENIKKVGNITEDKGTVKLLFTNFNPDISENAEGTTLVNLKLRLNDYGEKDEHDLGLAGVYHQDTGNIVVATRSGKFGGVYGLPQLNLMNDGHFNTTRWALYNEYEKTKIEDLDFSSVENLVDHSDQCEYIGYFHIESTNLTKEELKQIDFELSNPIGRPTRKVPQLKLSSGLLYSPNCAILLDISTSAGFRDEIVDSGLRNTMLFASMLVLLQIWLLINQMAQTNTPSTLSRLSFWTVAIINMADGSIAVISLLMSMIYGELYIQFAVCAFLAFTCSAIYEMKYGIQIYCNQLNERPLDWRTMLQGTPVDERAERRDQQAAENNANIANAGGTNTTTPNVNVDEQAIGAELYTRHFFTMLVFLFVLLTVLTWPKKQRLIFEYIATTIFNSYWIPQIYRNTLRGSRTSFSWRFILGTSILRLCPVIFLNIFANPFHHHRDLGFVIFLFFWMSIQLILLLLQELLGPRFFLNDKYLPQTYDYHPLITKGDIETGFSLDTEGLVSNGSSSADDDSRSLKYVTDCAICMQKVEIPIVDSGAPHSSGSGFGQGTANLVARRKYMVTPCKHVFHTECLENWMMYKLQCPVCRHSLPPF